MEGDRLGEIRTFDWQGGRDWSDEEGSVEVFFVVRKTVDV